MKKYLLVFTALLYCFNSYAQNLIVNPGAELLPRGTGWTVVNQGTASCDFIPTDNFTNWTMIPNGTVNYPYDHTTGSPGGIVFYAGCSDFFSGVLELQQTVNVSADAAGIDLGSQLYTFSGYLQTPVDNQTDQGRFVVDYLSASDVVLGNYSSPWQSYFGGSGTAWTFYTDTRVAPSGTRKIKVRLQAQIFFNRFAVNAYFDDISLTRPSVVPVRLISFTGSADGDIANLDWNAESEINLSHYEVERSTNGVSFAKVGNVAAGRSAYTFADNIRVVSTTRIFYRLKTVDVDGRIGYSNVVVIKPGKALITVWPNPATDRLAVKGTTTGNISIFNGAGVLMLKSSASTRETAIDISSLAAGIYFLRYADGKNTVVKKLLVRAKR